ncbi:MAG: hypothetical protein QE160_05645 [Candidatus Verstraetearchaeota archaeon]|nr:hypothetical protein [Candidatus Verstraetearchaeota archaeon]
MPPSTPYKSLLLTDEPPNLARYMAFGEGILLERGWGDVKVYCSILSAS